MSRPHRTSDAASDQARWQEICRLFDEALDRDPEEREAWLSRECRTDPSLLAEVRGMLAGHERSEGVLDAPPTAALGGILDRLEGTAAPARGTTAGPGPGETVGHYRIVRLVGRGGMGVVYQAWDPRLDRQVALKLLPASADADEGARARLLQEARRASALDHPNICTVYDVGPADGGALYIAMAYYAGGTVADRIAKGPLPVDEAVDLARQVLEGLDRAHEAGIVHRDVKPSNLAVTTRGEAKILDFGIACLAGAATTDGGPRRGTVGYMAPEQIAGAAIDQRVDLWALGVVLHEMLAGRPLFHGPDLHVVLDRVLHAAIPSLSALRPDVPAALEGIVRAALVRDPAGRYPSAAHFLADLEQFRSGTPPRPVSVPGRYQEAVVPGAVPRPISSLVGREAEIEALVELLGSARLVTVTGPGGVGKTRLAIETASRCVASSRDVSFVRLASVSSPDDVPLAIARSLGLVESPYRPLRETLRDALRDREALIVLDNFERVLDSAPVVLEILESSPGSRILVTSRGPLRLQGEHVFPVHPLGLPRRGAESSAARLLESPAVRLFVERATAADPGFTFDDDVAGTVAEICRRLDGIPLAIELAATRVGLLPPVALLHRLEKRLDVVGGRGRDLPDRHRTLEAAISWSVELLSEAERALFRRLSVFPGGARPGPAPRRPPRRARSAGGSESRVHRPGSGRRAALPDALDDP